MVSEQVWWVMRTTPGGWEACPHKHRTRNSAARCAAQWLRQCSMLATSRAHDWQVSQFPDLLGTELCHGPRKPE